MEQEQLRFLLINYSKTLGKYNRVKYPKQQEKEIRGNALITVPKSYIEELNISHSLPLYIVQNQWKQHQREIFDSEGKNKIVEVTEYKRTIRKGRGILAILKKIKTGSSHLNPEFQPKQYYFRFPHFFNVSMIDQALFSILENDPQLDKFYFFINGKRHSLLGEVTDWGMAKLSQVFIESNQHKSKLWGETVVTTH